VIVTTEGFLSGSAATIAPMSDTVVCLVTCPEPAAASIARAIVEAGNAACVNIVAGVESLYWWDGAVQQDSEALLVVKTTAALVAVLRDQLAVIHPYENFELAALPITGGNPDYLAWIAASVTRPA
jgi:periplasmic divalent cation tolerance protein